MKSERKPELKERFERRKARFFREKRRRRYSKEGLVEAARTIGGFAKAIFRPDIPFGIYLRNGCGFLALGWTIRYCCDHPYLYAAFPVFAAAGYNFVQALRHKDEVPVKYLEEFRARYRQEREERHRNRDKE